MSTTNKHHNEGTDSLSDATSIGIFMSSAAPATIDRGHKIKRAEGISVAYIPTKLIPMYMIYTAQD